MADQTNIVILAAGKGTRLKSNVPKPLYKALNTTLVDYVVNELIKIENKNTNLSFVVGHQKELVEKHIQTNFSNLNPSFIHQKEQLGTGHAVQCFFNEKSEAYNNEYTLIVCADTPLITSDIYNDLFKTINDQNLDAVCATFEVENPTGYGRIEHGSRGFNIIEEKDASDDQRKIKEVNSGLYIFRTSYIKEHINNLSNSNKSGEFYLTDLLKQDQNVVALKFSNPEKFLGINNLSQLARVEEILLMERSQELMANGVRMYLPHTIYIDETVTIEPGAIIHSGVNLFGNSKIAAGVEIESGCVIKDSTIGENTKILANSYIEKAQVGNNTQIGPMARLREGTAIGEDCKIGNFVETKKANLAKGAKVSHLSYVGDAQIGENTNIGCGFITCNYDGANKHQTIIGKNTFVGSDCQTIAPVTIGDEAYIGSGSTINKDVPDKAFAIARQRQETKENMAHKFLKKKEN